MRVLLPALMLLMTVQWAAAQSSQRFDVPEQPLADAVKAVAVQSNTNIFMDAQIQKRVGQRKSVALNGELTLSEALTQLLQGTGLTYEFINANTVTVTEQSSASNAPVSKDTEPMRLSRAETDQLQQVASQDSAAQEESSSDESGTKGVAEILVTGSHIRGAKDASPVIQIGREEIEKAGFLTVEEIFENLPQNVARATAQSWTERSAAGATSGPAFNNTEGASAIDLRGLGAQATLTLLNGARRPSSILGQAVDISSIPLAAVERVEVLAGGKSAIYGADAVAGVVNIITRRDFDGVEVAGNYGWSEVGGEQTQFSSVAGMGRGRFNLVGGYQYQEDGAVDITDTDLYRLQLPSSVTYQQTLSPKTRRNSAFLSGGLELTEKASLSFDGFYGTRDSWTTSLSRNTGAPANSDFIQHTDNEQYSASLKLMYELSADWRFNIGGTMGRADNTDFQDSTFVSATSASSSSIQQASQSDLYDLETTIEGAVRLGPLNPRFAVGAAYRQEDFENKQVINGLVSSSSYIDKSRDVKAVFAEISTELFANESAPFLRGVDVNLAARHDEYSDFGSTVNMQGGLIFTLPAGLRLRTAYSEAFRAPALLEYTPLGISYLTNQPDPTQGGAQIPVLVRLGYTPNLHPETATNWTATLDFEPEALPQFKASLSYYNIDYQDMVSTSGASTAILLSNVLSQENIFSPVISRSPMAASLAGVFDNGGRLINLTSFTFTPTPTGLLAAAPNLIVFDHRRLNLAKEVARGLDLDLDFQFPTDRGEFSVGGNATYILDKRRQFTSAASFFDTFGRVGEPSRVHVRLNGGWQRGSASFNLFLNHIAGYDNPFSTVDTTVGGFTTLDATFRYSGLRVFRGMGDGLSAFISVHNLFDKQTPRVLVDSPSVAALYDPANGNPFGRTVTLGAKYRF